MAQRDDADRLRGEPAITKKPEITREMRANARANPNSWLYVIDEAFDPDGKVPPWAVVGAYPVNARGEVVEDFHPNDGYLPSPKALGFPEPRNDLERLLQLVHTRHRPAEDVPPAVLDATLYVYAIAPTQRTLFGSHNADGDVVVAAYTAKSLVPSDWPYSRAVRGRAIIASLGGHALLINPDTVGTALVPAQDLARANSRWH